MTEMHASDGPAADRVVRVFLEQSRFALQGGGHHLDVGQGRTPAKRGDTH
jgi:hypothetical protein